MEYRICTLNDEEFWVQRKGWFFWHDMVVRQYPRDGMGYDEVIKFKSEEGALKWIHDDIAYEVKNDQLQKPKRKVVKIVQRLENGVIMDINPDRLMKR